MAGQFRNLVRRVGFTVPEAFRACSSNPAAVAGVSTRKGRIEPGFDADLVLFDSDLAIVSTYCKGRLAYSAGAASPRN